MSILQNKVEVFKFGVTIRDQASNALLCDFPLNSLKKIHDLGYGLFRFELMAGTSSIAVQLIDSNHRAHFSGQLQTYSISCENSHDITNMSKRRCLGIELPSLSDPTTQVQTANLIKILIINQSSLTYYREHS